MLYIALHSSSAYSVLALRYSLILTVASNITVLLSYLGNPDGWTKVYIKGASGAQEIIKEYELFRTPA